MSQRDYLEELELDLDDIRYEFNRICLKVREVEGVSCVRSKAAGADRL